MKFDILNRFNGSVQFTAEIEFGSKGCRAQGSLQVFRATQGR